MTSSSMHVHPDLVVPQPTRSNLTATTPTLTAAMATTPTLTKGMVVSTARTPWHSSRVSCQEVPAEMVLGTGMGMGMAGPCLDGDSAEVRDTPALLLAKVRIHVISLINGTHNASR